MESSVHVACNVPTNFIRAMNAIQTVASALFTCDIIEATTLACSVRSPRLIHFGASAHCAEASEYTRWIGNCSALKIRIIVYVRGTAQS